MLASGADLATELDDDDGLLSDYGIQQRKRQVQGCEHPCDIIMIIFCLGVKL